VAAAVPLRTVSGRLIDVLAPDPAQITIGDIAHALARLCRFGGHTREFYSVAQHSVLVSHLALADDARFALLHDASEAYLVDVPRPIKTTSALGGYLDVEERLQRAIYDRFGLAGAVPLSVAIADDWALAAEFRDLLPAHPGDRWSERAGDHPLIQPLPPAEAERLFLARFAALGLEGAVA
jgi:hypothetical protein